MFDEARKEALKLAVQRGGSIADVVDAASAFLSFLTSNSETRELLQGTQHKYQGTLVESPQSASCSQAETERFL